MKILDLNILMYAVNRDAPDHELAVDWLESCLSETEPVGLPWVVLLGFLRMTTNPRIMPNPLSPRQAMEIVDDWLQLASVRIISPTDRHWDILKDILSHFGTAANLTTDAHLAALAIERGAILYSTDSDFSRIPNLRWRNPVKEN